MLTRLHVKGFKNLVDADVEFGPFTCIAGANGVGKSNLLDAIVFLSALAGHTLMDAALSIRDEGGRTGDIRSLFHNAAGRYAPEMSFEAEMLVPENAVDDLGQQASATSTLLKYEIALRYRQDAVSRSLGSLELVKEELRHITQGEADKHVRFPSSKEWKKSVFSSKRRTPSFISTTAGEIKIHQDGGSSGKPRSLLASNLPRTALSVANAAESPTATVARREMESWRLLQLEPAALRRPDSFIAPAHIERDGSHLPATLYHMAQASNGHTNPERVYSEVANTLSTLIEDVRSVTVERDERRELLTLYVSGKDGALHSARSLSDGTLRFLALAVLAADRNEKGLICLEEPENGIHPARIPSMIRLLEDLAGDVESPTGPGNPLRQIIVNTHSPAVVMQIPDGSLLMAASTDNWENGRSFRAIEFRCLSGTWRDQPPGARTALRGDLLAYLNPAIGSESDGVNATDHALVKTRVMDRPDVQMSLPFGGGD